MAISAALWRSGHNRDVVILEAPFHPTRLLAAKHPHKFFIFSTHCHTHFTALWLKNISFLGENLVSCYKELGGRYEIFLFKFPAPENLAGLPILQPQKHIHGTKEFID